MSDDALADLTRAGERLRELEREREALMAEVRTIVRTRRDDIPLRRMSMAVGLSRPTIYKMLE